MPLKNLFSLTEPFGPPSPLAPLSETTKIMVLSSCSDLLEVVQQPADLGVGVREEPGVHLGHPREQPPLVGGQGVPRRGVVQRRERLAVGSGPGLRCADRVDRRQFGVGRHDAQLLLPGQDLLARRLVAHVEPALVPVGPLPGHVVRGVRAARRVVQEHRPVRGDRLDVVDELDRLVGEVDAEVVALCG